MRNVDCKRGVFVVDAKGGLGMIAGRGGHRIMVQYGPDGPYKWWHHDHLMAATEAEVKGGGLAGVGGIIIKAS